MKVESYLDFNGRCEEALGFYKKALGAEVTFLMRYSENPEKQSNPACSNPANDNKIMHCSFKVGETTLMASDGRCSGATSEFKGIMLTIAAATEDEADKLFGAISDGGKVHMPLTKTFFSPKFGMCADKFGVNWMVLVQH